MHRASGKRHRVVASSSPQVPLLPLLVGKDEQDLGKKSRGGRCPRGNVEGVFLSNTGSCTCSPGFVCTSCVVKMHASGARGDIPESFFVKKRFFKMIFDMYHHKSIKKTRFSTWTTILDFPHFPPSTFSKIARIFRPPEKSGFNFELRTFPDDDNS